ncbi:MAG: 5'-deoxyadenosine deaminase [Deltaproteobacteria bacterium]|nr:5'-deoxyadenosine deaminase [Deltaproteobacteria bacterium]
MDLLFSGGTIVTMDPERRVLEGDLLVRDGRIVALGEIPGEVLAAGHGQRPVDCRGKILIPGLIQSHVHLCQTLFRGQAEELELLDWLRERIWPFEAAHDPESLRVSAELGIAELIAGGTTACLDMGTVRHTDAIFEAAEETGFRLTGGKAMMDVRRGLPAGLREKTSDSLKESDRLRERWEGEAGGRLRYAYAPRFVLSCTEELLQGVAERCADGARVHTHASESQEELAAVRERSGLDNVAYLDRLGLTGERVALAHCVWLTAREQRILAETGTHLLHCPSSNLKLGSGLAKIPELEALGVHVALGPDGAPCNNNLDQWVEMRLMALIHLPRVGPAGFPARKVFEAATLGGARALGLEQEVGSLEVGKRGDLAVLDLQRPATLPGGQDIYSRLVFSAGRDCVETVAIDGQIVFDHGVFLTLDRDRVLREADAHARAIVGRIG